MMRGPGIVGCVWLPSAATTCDLGRGGVTPPPLVSLTQGPGGQGTGSVEAWFPPPWEPCCASIDGDTRGIWRQAKSPRGEGARLQTKHGELLPSREMSFRPGLRVHLYGCGQ